MHVRAIDGKLRKEELFEQPIEFELDVSPCKYRIRMKLMISFETYVTYSKKSSWHLIIVLESELRLQLVSLIETL